MIRTPAADVSAYWPTIHLPEATDLRRVLCLLVNAPDFCAFGVFCSCFFFLVSLLPPLWSGRDPSLSCREWAFPKLSLGLSNLLLPVCCRLGNHRTIR